MIFGGVVILGNSILKTNEESAAPSMVMPSPVTCWESPRCTVNMACSSPKQAPTKAAKSTPVQRSPPK